MRKVELKPKKYAPNWKTCDEVSTFIFIPIYDQSLELVVTKKLKWAERNRQKAFRINPGSGLGAVIYRKWRFALILEKDKISHELIAHEVFHATHRIMEYLGDKFTRRNHEPYAYLLGYLTREIYIQLCNWKLKVKT